MQQSAAPSAPSRYAHSEGIPMAVQQFPVVKADIASSSNPSLPGWLGPFASCMFGWLNTCSSYFAAAVVYNEMRGLGEERSAPKPSSLFAEKIVQAPRIGHQTCTGCFDCFRSTISMSRCRTTRLSSSGRLNAIRASSRERRRLWQSGTRSGEAWHNRPPTWIRESATCTPSIHPL